VVDRERADGPRGESNCRVEYRLAAGERVGIEEAVVLRGNREMRDGGSGVDAVDCEADLSRGAGGISSGGKSRAGSCTGDMLTETEEGGVGTVVRMS